MMVTPPVSGVNVGHSSGGGLLDTFKNTIAGVTGGSTAEPGQVDPGPKGDGSVGLFDGVLKKALFGGAAGAAMGFLPFIPGGPILGGVLGALGGAAMGAFSNWTKMKQIKQENEAMIAAMGVQVDQPEIKQVLQSGNVSQLIPLMQQSAQQVDPTVAQQQELAAQQQAAIQQGQLPTVVDPSTAGISQSPVPSQATVLVGSGAGSAINPNAGVDPGTAPANLGGGGTAIAVPKAPAGTNSSDVSAIAPNQAGVGEPTAAKADAAAGVETLTPAQVREKAQLTAMIADLQEQIKMLKQMIENDERRRAESLESEAKQMARTA